MDLGLWQEDVAIIIGTCSDTITGWENDRYEPKIKFIPAIIDFLGYNPYSTTATTFGERIKYFRTIYGLSHRKLGGMFGVDGSTISCWETGEFVPDRPNLNRIEMLLSL